MNQIHTDTLVDLIFHLKWKSEGATHTDGLHAAGVNMWRDVLPPLLVDSLMGRESGDRLQLSFRNGDIQPSYYEERLFKIRTDQFSTRFEVNPAAEPRTGRFYPKGVLRGIPGVFSENIQPFRYVGRSNGHLTVDFNHPLAGRDLSLSAVVGDVKPKAIERGGSSIDWMERLTDGAGMQARWRAQQTDYFSDDAFQRDDEEADIVFYRHPRLVHHIDAAAREIMKETYGRFLKDGTHILDLMSSWESHLPVGLKPARLVGLGLNEAELLNNPRLNGYVVHDLNTDPFLPFESESFDAVINTASVEYLATPLIIFKEVFRVLRPGGHFVVAFSNRWFAPKAIRIWSQLHEFERMGLVLEYFLRAGGFTDLHTYSLRGIPRPHDDPYFPNLRYADPVYVVWGLKN